MKAAAKEGERRWLDRRTLAQREEAKLGRAESEGPHPVAISICVLRDWDIKSGRRYRKSEGQT